VLLHAESVFCSHLPAAVNLLDLATAAKLAAKQQQPKQQTETQQTQPRSKQGQQQQLDEAVAAAPALKALADAGLDPVVPRCMAKLGFEEPTPIQAACWGPACAGKDLLGHAEPGECVWRGPGVWARCVGHGGPGVWTRCVGHGGPGVWARCVGHAEPGESVIVMRKRRTA
jgi:hypothetical protein